jgi:hypothetical protein
MSRLETKPLLPLGNDHSMHSGESYARRLLSIPREVIPLSLFAFGGPPAHLALAHDRFVCALLPAARRADGPSQPND